MRFPRQADEFLATENVELEPTVAEQGYKIVDGASVQNLDKGGYLWETLIIAAVVIILAGIGVFFFLRHRRTSAEPQAEGTQGEVVETAEGEAEPLKETPAAES